MQHRHLISLFFCLGLGLADPTLLTWIAKNLTETTVYIHFEENFMLNYNSAQNYEGCIVIQKAPFFTPQVW